MKINYYIEQCDNGIVIADKTDCKEGEVCAVEVALDKDICYQLGKWIWSEIKTHIDRELANAVELNINIQSVKTRL